MTCLLPPTSNISSPPLQMILANKKIDHNDYFCKLWLCYSSLSCSFFSPKFQCRQSCGLCGFMLRQVLQQELDANLLNVLVMIKIDV
ncbi:hypothetical protein F2Q70_00022874 [Brassica cretica]|uniref:Uncharacterized protein n=1 Tax=Brassica cretica TaxID=69181 RepID=A0A8S9GW34_BRACR|nr:hypothetical protein F2Q70_00022874 [Brassica cretica]